MPTRYCDDVEIETSISEVRRSSFHLQHRLTKDGALAVEGFESRVWVVRDPSRPGRLRPQAIPAELAERLNGVTAQP
jgi:4-hydroxybenzoyl-CoA thioesterase